jgi:hypothetical protein
MLVAVMRLSRSLEAGVYQTDVHAMMT